MRSAFWTFVALASITAGVWVMWMWNQYHPARGSSSAPPQITINRILIRHVQGR